MTRKVDYDKFQNLNVQILGISSDGSFAQNALVASLKLPFPLLSDYPDLKVIRRYDVLWPHQIGPLDNKGHLVIHPPNTAARRSFFLIDKQGIVRGQWFPQNKDVFNSEPILQRARDIVSKH